MDAAHGVMLFPFLLGVFVIVQLLRRPHEPGDDSNLFNGWRLLWYTLSPKWRGKLARLVDWLQHDEGDLLPLPDPPGRHNGYIAVRLDTTPGTQALYAETLAAAQALAAGQPGEWRIYQRVQP